MTIERKELLLARGLGKAFSERLSLSRTIARRMLRLGRPPQRYYVFTDANFTLLPGECVALIGGNGSGKSTFLRCLAGVLEPTDGEVLRIGKMGALLSHGFGAYEDLMVWQVIILAQQLLGASLRDARKRLPEVAATADLSGRLLSPCSHLSEGMRAKVALSALIHTPFRVALLDESLNHVDHDFREMFYNLTRKWIGEGRSLVMTSHDGELLHRFATRRLLFDAGKLVETD